MLRLRELREEYGIKRSKLARDLQMNAGTIANYENGIREAPYESLLKFAQYFDVTLDELLGREQQAPHTIKERTSLTETERQLLAIFRGVSRIGKNRILEYAELWQERENIKIQ